MKSLVSRLGTGIGAGAMLAGAYFGGMPEVYGGKKVSDFSREYKVVNEIPSEYIGKWNVLSCKINNNTIALEERSGREITKDKKLIIYGGQKMKELFNKINKDEEYRIREIKSNDSSVYFEAIRQKTDKKYSFKMVKTDNNSQIIFYLLDKGYNVEELIEKQK